MSRKILNGWKDISSYLNRGVRTAQRWELLLGMPVYRPALKDRSAVVAFSDELDRWLARQSHETTDLVAQQGDAVDEVAGPEPMDGNAQDDADSLSRMRANLGTLAWRTSELVNQTRALQEQLRRAFEIQGRRLNREGVAAGERRAASSVLSLRPGSTNDRYLAAG